MSVTYTSLLGLAKPATGTESGAWGDIVNDQITSLLDEAVADAALIDVTAGNVTLTSTDGVSNEARCAILLISGTPGTSRNILAPNKSKFYVVKNDSDSTVVLKGVTGPTTGVSISAGANGVYFWNGSDFQGMVSGEIVGTTDTQTLTNKRVTPRVQTTTSAAEPTINTDDVDMYGITAQAVDITSFTTNLSGTPTNGQKLWIYIVGTATRSITWGAAFESSTVSLPATTVSTDRLDVGFVWDAASSKWRCVASA